ncbi:MAG TPA: amidohydrolase family protein [Terriglobales bacterium]|nr:amidohydrolase family protein [Terriglobales bacterium]
MGIRKIAVAAVILLASAAGALWSQSTSSPAAQSAVPALPAEVPSTAERYSMLLMGNLAGQQAVWTAADGSLHVFFQFNDRGRGPRTTSILKLDAAGIPLSESITGNDYLKSPVDENFTNSGGVATWKNNAEQGERRLSTPAYYSPLNGAPTEYALLAQAALRNGGKISLLPEGEVRIERVSGAEVQAGEQKKRIGLYSMTGLDFSPTYVWLDDREKNQQKFFASVDEWGSIVPEGWETAVKQLLAVQDEVKHGRAAKLAAKLAHRPKAVLFEQANVFDAKSGQVIRNQQVLVYGNHIVSVGPTVQRHDWDPAPQVIDAAGKTLLPGLWDMHAHVTDNDGLLNLAAGVTTVRDLANDTDSLLARRQRIADGKEIGTRIVLAGIIDGKGPYQGPTKVLVSNEAEARAAVDNYKKLGYVQIKIYSSVPPAIVPAIIDEAHKNGMRVSGHIPANMTAAECVKLGYDEIQHINFLILNFFPEIKDTNTITRLTKPGEITAGLDLNSEQVKAFIKLLQDHHTKLDLTLTVFEDQYMARIGQISPGFAAVANRLPSQVRRGLLTAGMTPPPGMDDTYKKSFAKMLEYTGLLYRSGLSIEDGTDSMAGFALHRELELDVMAGIPATQVLQNATLNAAKIMSMDKDLGSIAPGKLADLTLVDGDPTKNISDIRKTVVTVKDGVLYYPAELYTELGVTP